MTDTDKGIAHYAHTPPTPASSTEIYGEGKLIVRTAYGVHSFLGYSDVGLTDQEVIETFGYAVKLTPLEETPFTIDSRDDERGLISRRLYVTWDDPRLQSALAEVRHSRWALYQRTLKPEWAASLETLSTMADNAEREDLLIDLGRGVISMNAGMTLSYLNLAKKYLDRVCAAHTKNPGSVYLRNLYDEAVAEVCRLIVISPKGYVLGSIYKAPTEPTNP